VYISKQPKQPNEAKQMQPYVSYEQAQILLEEMQNGNMPTDTVYKFISKGKNGGLFSCVIEYNEFDQQFYLKATNVSREEFKLPQNYQLPHGYTMQNVTQISEIPSTDIVVCVLGSGRPECGLIMVLKPFGFHGRYPCNFLMRGRFSNRICELSSDEQTQIELFVNNL